MGDGPLPLVPLGGLALAAPWLDALAAVQASGAVFTLAQVCLAEGFHRGSYHVLGVAAAVLTFAGPMVFVRFFTRELDS